MKGSIRENEEFQSRDVEFDPITKFLQVKTILVTGATGFPSKAVWSIWMARNDKIFNGKSVRVEDLLFHSKLRALVWLNATKGDSLGDFDGWWDNPRYVVNHKQVKGSSDLCWMKFSVACLVSLDHSAGGGVLIANGGVYKALFSGLMTQSNYFGCLVNCSCGIGNIY
ncbi:hypothetical protein GQ457_12G027450 [Hibiscus cannabinus]